MHPPNKSWKYWLVIELVYHGVFFFLFLAFFSSLIFAIAPLLLFWWFHTFIHRKPFHSKIYRLPLLKCEGVVLEKHTHKFPASSFLREWVTFNTADGWQIRVYLASTADGKFERWILSEMNPGDAGTLHYRKGRKHLYFEDFDKFEPDAEGDAGD